MKLLIFLILWNIGFGLMNAAWGIIAWRWDLTALGAANLAVAYFVIAGVREDRGQ